MAPSLIQSVQSSVTTCGLGLFVALVYAAIVRLGFKVPVHEVALRMGLRHAPLRYFGYALLGLAVFLPANHVVQAVLKTDNSTSPYQAFRGLGLTMPVVGAALAYAVLAAGIGEELIFRGLIAGALGRRFSLHMANLIQALTFLAPHLLLLLIVPHVWWALIPFVLGLGLVLGWLRLSSGSLWPAVALHGGANFVVGLMYAVGWY